MHADGQKRVAGGGPTEWANLGGAAKAEDLAKLTEDAARRTAALGAEQPTSTGILTTQPVVNIHYHNTTNRQEINVDRIEAPGGARSSLISGIEAIGGGIQP
jgi:hypothetical protein